MTIATILGVTISSAGRLIYALTGGSLTATHIGYMQRASVDDQLVDPVGHDDVKREHKAQR